MWMFSVGITQCALGFLPYEEAHQRREVQLKNALVSRQILKSLTYILFLKLHMWGWNNEIRPALFRLFTSYFIALKEAIRS